MVQIARTDWFIENNLKSINKKTIHMCILWKLENIQFLIPREKLILQITNNIYFNLSFINFFLVFVKEIF